MKPRVGSVVVHRKFVRKVSGSNLILCASDLDRLILQCEQFAISLLGSQDEKIEQGKYQTHLIHETRLSKSPRFRLGLSSHVLGQPKLLHTQLPFAVITIAMVRVQDIDSYCYVMDRTSAIAIPYYITQHNITIMNLMDGVSLTVWIGILVSNLYLHFQLGKAEDFKDVQTNTEFRVALS